MVRPARGGNDSRRIGAAWAGRRRGVDPRDFGVCSLILMGSFMNRSSEP